MDAPASFYERLDGGRFRTMPSTVGPWSPTLQHGSPPSALLVHELERLAPRPLARIARVSIEILGPIPVEEITIATEIVRPGKKVELLSAIASIGGRPALRATAWRLAAEPGRSPAKGPREAAPPFPPPEPQVYFEDVGAFPYGEALEWRFGSGGFRIGGPATVWARCRIPIVLGEELSPLCRLMAMVDSANGVSAELPVSAFTFVPVDLTVVVHRPPRGEWVGMHAATTIEDDGVGMTRTRLFDADGQLGGSLHTLFVAPR